MWVALILQVIVPILVKLVQKWLANRNTNLADHKQEFLDAVVKHPKLHKKKLKVAEALFDKTVRNYEQRHEMHLTTTDAAAGEQFNLGFAMGLVKSAAEDVETQFAHESEDDE